MFSRLQRIIVELRFPHEKEYIVLGALFVASYALSVTVSLVWGAWLWLCIGIFFWVRHKRIAYPLGVLAMALIIMSIAPVTTDTAFGIGVVMLLCMATVVALPVIMLSKKETLAVGHHFRINFRESLKKRDIGYIVFPIVQVVPVLYFYLLHGDVSGHWQMETTYDTVVTFFAIMIIGIWEEFFFIAIIFGILRQYMRARWAMILQAVAFTAFLYQVGFTGWVVPLLFYYTLYQGYAYYKTKNLLVTLIIHFIIDFCVFFFIYGALHGVGY